jgi:hypothetical protein
MKIVSWRAALYVLGTLIAGLNLGQAPESSPTPGSYEIPLAIDSHPVESARFALLILEQRRRTKS